MNESPRQLRALCALCGMSWQFPRQSRTARLIRAANIGLLFSFFLREEKASSGILELCVPINLLQVGSNCFPLHPLQRAQSVSVPMATLPWERGRKEKRCRSIYEMVLLYGAALPAACLNGLSFFFFPPSLISLSIDCSLPEGIIGFKSFIFWFLNCSSSPGSLLLLEVRAESQSH